MPKRESRYLGSERPLHEVVTQLFYQETPQRAQEYIERGLVFVNGQRVEDASQLVAPKSRIIVHERSEASDAADVSSQTPPKVRILHEDDDLLVVNKSWGIHVNETETSGERSLLGLLKQPELRLVHRLDKDTSGVLVLAKSRRAAQLLSEAFRDRKVDKEYVAIVENAPLEKRIDAPVAVDRRRPRARMVKASGQPAQTEVLLVQSVGSCSSVRLRPLTGRTHQLRVHLSYVGSPIVGDLLYGAKPAYRIQGELLRASRSLLHAEWIKIPWFGKSLSFRAGLPEDFEPWLAQGLTFG